MIQIQYSAANIEVCINSTAYRWRTECYVYGHIAAVSVALSCHFLRLLLLLLVLMPFNRMTVQCSWRQCGYQRSRIVVQGTDRRIFAGLLAAKCFHGPAHALAVCCVIYNVAYTQLVGSYTIYDSCVREQRNIHLLRGSHIIHDIVVPRGLCLCAILPSHKKMPAATDH